MRMNVSKGIITAVVIITVPLALASILGNLHILPVRAMLNPSAVYCEACGYIYIIETVPEGEVGLCELPDGQKVDAWDFLRGNVALEWSYCAQQGYEAKHVEESDICWDCTVCVLPDGSEIEVTELMELSFEETSCGDGTCGIPENYETCPEDCPSGSQDGYCDGIEDGICDPDCESGLDPDCGEEVPGGGLSGAVIGGIIVAAVIIILGTIYLVMRSKRATKAA
jgi:putative hemolysin